MPIRVTAYSIRKKELAPGELWDVTFEDDNLIDDLNEDVSVILNIGELSFQDQSALIVQGSILSMLCGHMNCYGTGKTITGYNRPFHIGILSRKTSRTDRALNGENGKDGVAD